MLDATRTVSDFLGVLFRYLTSFNANSPLDFNRMHRFLQAYLHASRLPAISAPLGRRAQISPRSRTIACPISITMPPKRKSLSMAGSAPVNGTMETPILPPASAIKSSPRKRRAFRKLGLDTNPDHNPDIVDGKFALRASPDADEKGEALAVDKVNAALAIAPKTNGLDGYKEEESDSPLSDLVGEMPRPSPAKKFKKTPTKSSIAAKKGSDEIKAFKAEQAARKTASVKVKQADEDEWDKRGDPDAGEIEGEDVDIMKKEAARPPPVNSDYLPLPWKGRLGYVSCCT